MAHFVENASPVDSFGEKELVEFCQLYRGVAGAKKNTLKAFYRPFNLLWKLDDGIGKIVDPKVIAVIERSKTKAARIQTIIERMELWSKSSYIQNFIFDFFPQDHNKAFEYSKAISHISCRRIEQLGHNYVERGGECVATCHLKKQTTLEQFVADCIHTRETAVHITRALCVVTPEENDLEEQDTDTEPIEEYTDVVENRRNLYPSVFLDESTAFGEISVASELVNSEGLVFLDNSVDVVNHRMENEEPAVCVQAVNPATQPCVELRLLMEQLNINDK